jgi:hypothetical protein
VAYVREGDQFVTGVDLATGRPRFCAAFIPPPGSGPYPDDVVGQPHAGAGMLLVPIGYGLVALQSGATSSGCPSASGGPGSQPAGTARPALSLRVGRTDVTVGRRVTLRGALRGLAGPGGRTIRLESDGFPFGRWSRLRDVTTAADGSFSTRITVRRNTRVRAVLSGSQLASSRATIYGELPVRLRRLHAGGDRPRVRVTVRAPRKAAIRRQRVSFYLAGRRATTWRRVDRRRWHAISARRIAATGAYPAGRLGRRDRVLACTRERRPDAYGRPSPLDPLCGRARLPRSTSTAAIVRPRTG